MKNPLISKEKYTEENTSEINNESIINETIDVSINDTKDILNGQKKLDYARDMLWEDMYYFIWENFLLDEGLTIAKIDLITYSLSKELIIAIWMENIVNKDMTDARLEYISNNKSIEEINKIWWYELIYISIAKLILSEDKYNIIWVLLEEHNISLSKTHNIEKKLTVEQMIVLWINNIIKKEFDSYRITAIWKLTIEEIRKQWWYKLITMPLAQLLLQEDKYNALVKILVDTDLIKPTCFNAINKSLSVKQIFEIWWKKLLSMNNTRIINYNQ